MGYKVYVKDATTHGRFVQWDGKNRSRTGAAMEATAAKAKYSKYNNKPGWGKQKWIVRKARKTQQRNPFGFSVPSAFRMRI